MTTTRGDLWHYTCRHAAERIGVRGVLYPAAELADTDAPVVWTGRYVWLTDLRVPVRDVLGLTQQIARCDRTQYRYRALNAAGIVPWTDVRRDCPREWRDELEGAPGARPRHWFVAAGPVNVQLDRRRP